MEGCARSVFFVRNACAKCTVRARSVLFVREFYLCAICVRFVSFVRDLLFVRDLCAISVIRARYLLFVHDIYYSCAIFIICAQYLLFVRDLCAIHVLFVRNLCAIFASLCAPRTHDVFVGPGFEPLTMQHDLFTGPRFNSRAWLTVSGQ